MLENINVFVVYNTITNTYSYAVHFKKTGRYVCGDSALNFVYGGPVQRDSLSWYMNQTERREAGYAICVGKKCAEA